MKRTTVWLSDPQIKCLEIISKRRGLKMAELIRRGIDLLIASEAPKPNIGAQVRKALADPRTRLLARQMGAAAKKPPN
jgi:hypothetical protein